MKSVALARQLRVEQIPETVAEQVERELVVDMDGAEDVRPGRARAGRKQAERAEQAGVTYVSKQQLFEQADVLSVHLVLSDRSRGLVDAQALQRAVDRAGDVLGGQLLGLRGALPVTVQLSFLELAGTGPLPSKKTPEGRAVRIAVAGNPPDPQEWLAAAETVQGTWWSDYTSWLADRSRCTCAEPPSPPIDLASPPAPPERSASYTGRVSSRAGSCAGSAWT